MIESYAYMGLILAIFARDMGALRALCDEEDVVVRINTPRKEDQCYPIHAAAIKVSLLPLLPFLWCDRVSSFC